MATFWPAVLLTCLSMQPAVAKTLLVGPDRALKVPSAAARIAVDGDEVSIEPVAGGYYDCAIWRANNLTIVGEGSGATITDSTCQGKALFVTVGHDVTIRNLIFTRARVPDQNGAGIRAEGKNLRVEHSRFVDNESGILVANQPDGVITVVDSDFIGNGKCTRNHCAHGISTGALALLHVEDCGFTAATGGNDISSQAQLTELLGNRITDGGTGAAVHLVSLPNGGSLIMRGNQLEKGPRSSGPEIAVEITAGIGSLPVHELTFTDNRLQNDTGGNLVFISNWTSTEVQITGNSFIGTVTPVSRAGYSWFFAKSFVRYSLGRVKELVWQTRSLL